jgi:dTDP-4-amino-4,6-dideoxygalactose transaminase
MVIDKKFPMEIGFNKPFLSGKELSYIKDAGENQQLAGDGIYTKKVQEWLLKNSSSFNALLTHSCTAALEVAAILLDVEPGDEIIMPSFTFVSSANAFVLRGGVPVFVDIRSDTLNMDENLIEQSITPKTKAILPVHYAGVACEMDSILKIAKKYNLFVIEDAAQGILSKYSDKTLGSIGDLGCLSFHETKNIISGEGGALLINNANLSKRAEIIREKGTNRKEFFDKKVDKYSWIDIGSSYLPGEIIAAFLYAQLEIAEHLISERISIWNIYDDYFRSISEKINIKYPTVPDNCTHNGHMYYLIFENQKLKNDFLAFMLDKKIHCVTHYVPLHSSVGGKKYGKTISEMPVTNKVASCLVRLPLWIGLETERVITEIDSWIVNHS